MKKILAIALCLMMVMSFAAVAETAEKTEIGSITVNGAFTLKAAVPEGYTIIPFDKDDFGGIWYIASEDLNQPFMSLTISFDEEYAEVGRLNDLSDEEIAAIVETFTSEYEVEVSYPETGLGTKLIQVVEVGEYTDFVDIFTIYQGYCVEFVLIGGASEDATLTQENIEKAIAFLTDLDFEPIDAVE